MVAAGPDEADLLRRLTAGDRGAADRLFTLYSDRLRGLVRLRLNRRLQGRIDPADVVQEAYLESCKRLDDYVQSPQLPFFLWLRHLTALKLLEVHRQHLGTRGRDARREDLPAVDSAALAAEFVGQVTSPSRAAVREEARRAVQQALEQMDEIDREVLVLRHFECLSNDEVAQLLDLTRSAASNRYVRALKRMRVLLDSLLSEQ